MTVVLSAISPCTLASHERDLLSPQTLWFVVQRQAEIDAFVPRHYWELSAHVGLVGGHETVLAWVRNPCFDERHARRAASAVQAARQLTVVSANCTRRTYPPPVGLNTVALLKLASSALGLSPHRAMQIAEELYTSGLISYPRTESTKYPPSFDVRAALAGHEHSQEWGRLVRWLQLDAHRAPPRDQPRAPSSRVRPRRSPPRTRAACACSHPDGRPRPSPPPFRASRWPPTRSQASCSSRVPLRPPLFRAPTHRDFWPALSRN